MVLGPDLNFQIEFASLHYHKEDFIKVRSLLLLSSILLMLMICSTLRFEQIVLHQKISTLQSSFSAPLSEN